MLKDTSKESDLYADFKYHEKGNHQCNSTNT